MNIKMKEINLIEISKADFLSVLSEYPGAPSSLYYKGTIPPKRTPAVAIVGTRRPTHYGKQVTYDLAYQLAKRGILIVSGLALGIDAIAHRAALDAGGITIAVLAGGLDRIYPRTNSQLAQEILNKGGALISEYPTGTPAKPFQFLARNRIVSGLADGVVVTEAAARSGTFSTVMSALDQGKEVCAVPGNITSVLSVGPNRLLKQGATPVIDVEDILAVIAPTLKAASQLSFLGATDAEQLLISLIQSGITDSGQLQQQSHQSTSQFLATLTMLEINGAIKSIDGNNWVLT
jgi:DNA processing protein